VVDHLSEMLLHGYISAGYNIEDIFGSWWWG